MRKKIPHYSCDFIALLKILISDSHIKLYYVNFSYIITLIFDD